MVQNELQSFVDNTIKRLSSDITRNLVESTPVDTGFARANWIPKIGSPFQGTAGTREQAEAGNINPGPQQQGRSEVNARYTTRLGPIYISNNVPYITELNEGSSRQAPRAFVQRDISRSIRGLARRGNNR